MADSNPTSPGLLGFRGGPNIAMKIRAEDLENVLRFYRDILGLPVKRSASGSWTVDFACFVLWLDVSEAKAGEIWLEIIVSDAEKAKQHLLSHGIVPDSKVEPLPPDYPGFWIRNPTGTIHLVSRQGA